MRFLVIPNTDEFMDRNSLWGLVNAIRAAGHEAIFPATPLDGFELAPICRDLGIDVVFALNRARPYDLPKNIRHIAWFQDQPHIPRDLADRVQASDLVYRVLPRADHEPDVNGRCFSGFLFLAIDSTMVDAYVPPPSQTMDFSFCGTMVPPFPYFAPTSAVPTTTRQRAAWKNALLWAFGQIDRLPPSQRRFGHAALRTLTRGRLPIASPVLKLPHYRSVLVSIAELYNKPLVGDWNPDMLAKKMHELLTPRLPDVTPEIKATLDAMYAGYALEVPRLMERFVLVESILHITDSVGLYGVNWDKHPMFAPYHKGVVTGPQALFSVFGRSRLNGANTLRSILHRRTLECMSIGAFLFINASVNDQEIGGLKTFFEPGTHYGEYKPDNIQEEALRWLRDEGRRKQVGERAAAAVRKNHFWSHRVDQILTDLRSHG